MEKMYYLMRRVYLWRIPFLPRFLMFVIRIVYGSFIPYKVKIGQGVNFGHKMGIVIAPGATIGRCVKIRQQVTIGSGHAVIGDFVEIGAGAKIIGSVRIGDGAKIGANAVVVSDVPSGATAVGVPARVIGTAMQEEHG
jgi:serine O-acetyltransferase